MSGSHEPQLTLGAYQDAVDHALGQMEADRVLERIWAGDHTVWSPDPSEITNRLGWLRAPDSAHMLLPQLKKLASEVRSAGYSTALLLGMGGSSLAPEVFRKTFGSRDGYLELRVLDSTDPGAVLRHAEELEVHKTLYVAATKSGGTVETLSFLKYFYTRASAAVGPSRAGDHFVAITDPGSRLVELASTLGFRATLTNDPNVGGRYSALTYFGLLPATLLGIDVPRLLDSAQSVMGNSSASVAIQRNPAARLGATLGELARSGRNKATFALSQAISSFGDWVEQLIAESTGKRGGGIVPVVGEDLGPPGVYGPDRFFVHLRLEGHARDDYDERLARLAAAGHPTIRFDLEDRYDLGAQLYLWEMATAVAGSRMGINPFDQPDVESAKVQARRMVDAYGLTGSLPAFEPGAAHAQTLERFLDQAVAGDYVALQAFVQPTEATDRALGTLRQHIRDRTRLATTVGYGPRFLHSTGQLHKGDSGSGLFVQLTAPNARDVPIPDEPGSTSSSVSFGVLEAAQALGDLRALRDAGRRVVRFDLGLDVVKGIARLIGSPAR